MVEIWRPILGYESDYDVSSFGRVRSKKYGKERILKQEALTGGYMYVFLSKRGKVKSFRVHRLVAIAFLKNEKGLPEVNHKDENVKNNSLYNLEWASPEHNKKYGSRIKRISKAKEKPVLQIDPVSEEVIASFPSGKDAAESLGLNSARHIYSCCRGERERCSGFRWRFACGG